MTLTKITAKIHPKIWERFSNEAESMFLKKAAYLDHLIGIETKHLKADMEGCVLSKQAKRFIAGELKRKDPINVNIEVRQLTSDALKLVVDEHNLVRDAFINRLLYFFCAPDTLMLSIDVPTTVRNLNSLGGNLPMSPARALAWIHDDPLFYLRETLREGQSGIYNVGLLGLEWMACFIDDKFVPGTAAFLEQKQHDNFLFDSL